MNAEDRQDRAGRRWVDFRHRGVAVTPGAMRAFIADRWRVSGHGLKGLRSFAGGLRRGSRAAASAVMPPHVFDLWSAQGRPDCWINYRPDGMSCLIIIPGDRVIRVPRVNSAAMRTQFAAAAATQSRFPELAPRVLETGNGGTHSVEAYLSLSGGTIGEADVETMFGQMEAVSPRRIEPASALVSSMLAGLDLPEAVARGAADLCRAEGASRVALRPVHGDLVTHNLWRREDGGLVAVDWEFSREAPATYDLWHLNLMPWIRGEITLDEWMTAFTGQLTRCLPDEVARVRLHHRLNALSTAAFLLRTEYGAFVPEKLGGLERLVADSVDYDHRRASVSFDLLRKGDRYE